MSQTRFRWIRPVAVGTAAATVPIAAGIVYSAVAIDHAVPLSPAIAATQRRIRSVQAGEMNCYVDEIASGRPLVLVHSVNAAASAYEMRPLFERYRGQRPVYAPDLPGFGFSERTDRVYTPALYADALIDILREATAQREAADVVALSLGSEFAARAALRQPDLVHSLTLISPTGLSARTQMNRSERAGTSQVGDRLYSLFRFPLWSQAFYDMLASRQSIRYFLQRSFVGEPDSALVSYAYATSHQPGARYAPLAFVSGQLFTPEIRESVYERLKMPVLALYDRDGFVSFDTLPDVLRQNPNWRSTRLIPSNGLPQFERLDETVAAMDTFWQEIEAGKPSGISRRS